MRWLIHVWHVFWGLAAAIASDALEPIQMGLVNRGLRGQVFTDPDIAALTDDDIAAYLTADGARAKELDEKLQKLTAAVSVAVTVGGLVGQTMLGVLAASTLKTATAFVFLLAEFYLVIGVVAGFDGLRPRPRYGYGPGFMRLMAEGGVAKRDELLRAANASLRDNIMRANQASAAATAIRNGILIFAVAVILGLVAVDVAPLPSSSTASQPAASPSLPALGGAGAISPLPLASPSIKSAVSPSSGPAPVPATAAKGCS